jgi:endonuclease/exonuclease/phosphatase family metal-dependent hydrolase
MNLKNLTIIIILSLSQAALAAKVLNKKKVSFSLMTYNLENLFDITHDKGKLDWTYLPLKFKNNSAEAQKYCLSMTNEYYKKSCLELDWSEKILNIKIKNLSKVITAYNNGKGADIVVFQEVENINAIKLLLGRGLNKKGYKYAALIEGPDTRGIDVGIISKYPIVSTKFHNIDLSSHSNRTTRGILQARIKIKGKFVTVFANHWPSQGNDDETREIASLVLKNAAMKVQSGLVIATGDFNTLPDDLPHGINNNILPFFEDVEVIARRVIDVSALGTHWYKGEWKSLDKIFVLKKSLSKKASANHKSYEILNHKFMVKDIDWTDRDTGTVTHSENVPNRFNSKTGEGFSDHLPVAIKFSL